MQMAEQNFLCFQVRFDNHWCHVCSLFLYIKYDCLFTNIPLCCQVLAVSAQPILCIVIKYPASYHCNRAIQDRTIFQPVHNEIKIVTTSIFTWFLRRLEKGVCITFNNARCGPLPHSSSHYCTQSRYDTWRVKWITDVKSSIKSFQKMVSRMTPALFNGLYQHWGNYVASTPRVIRPCLPW